MWEAGGSVICVIEVTDAEAGWLREKTFDLIE